MKPASLPNSSTDQFAPGAVGRAAPLLKRAVVGLLLLAGLISSAAWVMHASLEFDRSSGSTPESAERAQTMTSVRNWSLQLGGLNPHIVSTQPIDLVVVDPAHLDTPRVKTRDRAFTALREKPDGSRRLVLARLALGMTETGRAGWQANWVGDGGAPSPAAPPWLGPVRMERPDSYHVRFWEPGWQATLLGTSDAAVNRIVADGYDGAWLDLGEAVRFFRTARPSAEVEMADLVIRISNAAREANTAFLVVIQGSEELLAHARLRHEIDAVAKDGLLYSASGSGHPNDKGEVAASLHFLDMARRIRKPVLAIEHIQGTAEIATARRRHFELGNVVYIDPASRPMRRLD